MHFSSSLQYADSVDGRALWSKFLLCCFLIICGVRIFLVEKFGVPVAWGDDLDGIARRILLPWENGTLTWSAVFGTHNGDHRIALTRLWEILWYEINGSWDPKLVMIAKVPIFAAAAVTFIHILAGGLERGRFLAGALLTVLFAFPFAVTNLIWAFQSQFDFFLLATALGWLMLLKGKPVAALVLALSTVLMLGSAPVVAASYLPFFAVMWLQKRWTPGRVTIFGAAALAIVAIGLGAVTGDRMPHSGTPAEKAATFARIYAWPHGNLLSVIERLPEVERAIPGALLRYPSPDRSYLLQAAEHMRRHPASVVMFNTAAAIFVVAPMLAVLLGFLRRRMSLGVAIGPLAVSGFAFLMIAATAIARAKQVTIASRYLDPVSLAGFASLACCFVLLAQTPRLRRWLALWGAIMGVGYAATMAMTLAQLSRRAPAASLAILQRYYATTPHDHSAMTDGEGFRYFIVGDDPTQFMSELDQPGMERVLPRAVTAPSMPPGRAAAVASWIAQNGLVIVLLAAIGACYIVVRSRRVASYATPVLVPVTPA